MKGEEISVPHFLYPLIKCIYLVFLTQIIPAIVNKMANFKRSNFVSSGVSILSLQINCMVQLTVYIS